MTGPTDFPQLQTTNNVSVQTITTTNETVICTSQPVNSRGANYPINITGSSVFAIQAATTGVTMRLRLATLTGTLIGAVQVVSGATAGTSTAGDGTVSATYTPAQEVAGLLIVLTIQATAAGANWNVTNAQLVVAQ